MPLKLNKKDILTVPNLLSLFRLLLIPVIIWLYCTKGNYYAAFGAVVLSGLTDVLDGKIARHFNAITDLGKILDPVADKLTQAALIICLISRYPLLWALIILFVIKELVSAALGYLSIQASGTVCGAQWYGKVNTVILYAVMILLILLPDIPRAAANGLIILCGLSLMVAFVLYVLLFREMVLVGLNRLKDTATWQSMGRIIGICLWLLLILFCLVYRDKVTLDSILTFVPRNSWAAALVMLLLFALKSISVFIYAGLLFAANGILFSLPVALAMSLLGAAVMFSVPYFLGRRGGAKEVKALAEKYPDLQFLQGFPSQSPTLLNFVARIIGILPADVVSLYMGLVNISYPKYILGSVAGMAVSCTTFTIMGMAVNDVTSPQFYLALVIEVVVNVGSLLVYLLYLRKKKRS